MFNMNDFFQRLRQCHSMQEIIVEIANLDDAFIREINQKKVYVVMVSFSLRLFPLSSESFIRHNQIDIELMKKFLEKIKLFNFKKDFVEEIIFHSLHSENEKPNLLKILFYSVGISTLTYLSGFGLLPAAIAFIGGSLQQVNSLMPYAMEGLIPLKLSPILGERLSRWLSDGDRLTQLPFRLFFRGIHGVNVLPEDDLETLKETTKRFLNCGRT